MGAFYRFLISDSQMKKITFFTNTITTNDKQPGIFYLRYTQLKKKLNTLFSDEYSICLGPQTAVLKRPTNLVLFAVKFQKVVPQNLVWFLAPPPIF